MKSFANTYKMAILIGVFFSLNALAISTVAALSGVDHWENLTYTQRICIGGAIASSWTNTMLAFFNKTLARLEAGKAPIDTGHSDPPFKPEPRA